MANAPRRTGVIGFNMINQPASTPKTSAPSTMSIGAQPTTTAPKESSPLKLGSHRVEAPSQATAPPPAKKVAAAILPQASVPSQPTTAATIPWTFQPPPVAAPNLPLVPTVAPTAWAPQPLPTSMPAIYIPPHQRIPSRGQLRLEELSRVDPPTWENLIGLYFLQADLTPRSVGMDYAGPLSQDWMRNFRWLDEVEKWPNADRGQWMQPANQEFIDTMKVITAHGQQGQQALEGAARTWQNKQPDRVERVLNKAGWFMRVERDQDWEYMSETLKMPDGEERSRKLAHVQKISPRFYKACVEDYLFCGRKDSVEKYVPSEDDDPNIIYDRKYKSSECRVPGSDHRNKCPKTPPGKPKMVNNGPGLPTQFHGVPLEERAIDSNGNRLPWALEYHEDHPSARGQKRHVEEKGPFGKSKRHRGSSRTRTATPAKKENPTLDGFEQAMKYDAKKEAESRIEASNRAQRAMLHAASPDKEPTQIMIYGYPPSRQYAAIDRYEKCCGGMICEDYEREPPVELQKYPNTFNDSRPVHPRPLTKQEMALSFKYDGGDHWVKLTCDSASAATRAIENSPIQVYGHWVYAELWNGKGPESDEPILVTDEDRRRGSFNNPRPPHRSSQTLSAAFSQPVRAQLRATSTLPKSFNPNATSHMVTQPGQGADSTSPSTASSATATGPDFPDLRNRPESQDGQKEPSIDKDEIAPGIRRYHLRPESEAYPPSVSWWERQIQWLRAEGWIPGDFIGWDLPVKGHHEFDWEKASWYWRVLYTIDNVLGTDICTIRDKTD